MNLSSVPGFGTGIDPYQAINAIASRQAQQAQQAQLKMVLMMVLAYTGANANSGAGALTASNPGFGGGGRSQNGVSSFLGASPAGGTGGSGDGQAAVDLARKFAGKDSSSIKGKMPHFTAAGGITRRWCHRLRFHAHLVVNVFLLLSVRGSAKVWTFVISFERLKRTQKHGLKINAIHGRRRGHETRLD